MIFKSAFPNAPVVRVVIDGVSVDYTSIEAVTLSFAENEHDIAEFVFIGLIPTAVTDYADRPVHISIEFSPTQIVSFYGYVSFIEPEAITRKGFVNNSPLQKAHVVCLGASYDMKTKKNRAWTGQTLPQIVDTIAKDYGYSYDVPADSFVFPRLTQHQESDWSFLVKTCTQVGYKVTATGAHIHVYDPFKTISRAMPYAELTTMTETQGNVAYGPGRIMEFRGTFGSVTPEGSSNAFSFESLSNDGKIIQYDTSDESMGLGEVVPARFTDGMAVNATSQAIIQKYALAAVRNRAPYHAEAVVTGIPEVLPGSLVKLTKYNGAFDGFWMVQKVTQKVSRSNYITELKLVRDSTNDSNPVDSSGQAYLIPDSPVLKNGIWKSEVPAGSVYI